MKNRNQLDKKYTWDSSHIYKDLDEFNKDLKIVEQGVNKIGEFKGKLGNKKDLLNYFN